MKWKKSGMLLVFLLVVFSSLFLTSCDDMDEDFGVEAVFEKIIDIATLDYFDDEAVLPGVMRVLIAILVFALLFEGSRLIGLNTNVGITVALVLAVISVIFIPNNVLIGIGSAYGTLVAFLLVGIPVFVGGYALYALPADNRWLVGLKIVIILVLIWILVAVKSHAKGLL